MTSVFLVAGGVEMDVGSSSVGAVPVGLVPAFFLLPRTYVRGYPVPSLRDLLHLRPSNPALKRRAIVRRPYGTGVLRGLS
jgi:hypothetical protein